MTRDAQPGAAEPERCMEPMLTTFPPRRGYRRLARALGLTVTLAVVPASALADHLGTEHAAAAHQHDPG